MAKSLTYIEVLNKASKDLLYAGKEPYGAKYLLLERQGWTETDWLLNLRSIIPHNVEQQLQRDVAKLLQDVPPQYLLGYEYFYGRKFQVNQHTLIPRPETEELVQLCLKSTLTKSNLIVADIGTGSGAIALTLKKERPDWQIIATDISESALMVAKKNAEMLQCEIDFRLGRSGKPFTEEELDIVVCNPPYISEEERSEMDDSVKKYEPQSALFATHQGLAVYQELARELPYILKPSGMVFLEIGYRQGIAVQQLFQGSFPEKKISVLPDLSGHDRIVWIR